MNSPYRVGGTYTMGAASSPPAERAVMHALARHRKRGKYGEHFVKLYYTQEYASARATVWVTLFLVLFSTHIVFHICTVSENYFGDK